MVGKKLARMMLALMMLALAFSLAPGTTALADDPDPPRGRIVVANRGSGSISMIDAQTGVLTGTYPLPAGDSSPEPMYVVYSAPMDRLFVGDRANDRVVVFDARTLTVETTVPTGAGVFHMWADASEGQLWVVADADEAVSVIDTRTLGTLATVPIPADLAAIGGFPHDVTLDPTRTLAFVSILGVAGSHDYVVQYSTSTFTETGRAAVGKDPHLGLFRQDDKLYVPSQGGSTVMVLDRVTMAELSTIPVPGAHGAGLQHSGSVFYTTNLPGGGMGGLVAIDTSTDNALAPATNTLYPVPHNIALTPSGHTLYVTHSGGTADKVTYYTAQSNDPRPVYAGEVTVGLNPFGITYMP